ncbi:hypothetical protein [uncultured Pseudokineococcus sp.]|uniref:hypothetical protein n=1 Tax=uncultured Pseudokineococcus sp. TaxID=1642928 RepID=UPI00262FACCE|nr:hypothetical protein [uncultured Pseudokineococcus sp.]
MPFGRSPLKVNEVFGVSNSVLKDSYVDRGALDGKLKRLLKRRSHLALKGASKSGKSWLRQTLMPDAIVVQCRLNKTVLDIYREALGELGIRLEVNSVASSSFTGTVEATAEVGVTLLAKVMGKLGYQATTGDVTTTEPVSRDVNDLRFIADLILESGRRLVIEDFHYLSRDERQKFAFDLKALWDFGVFVVVIGVWSDSNYLLHLNPDLTARIREESIVWSKADLEKIFTSGGAALGLDFSEEVRARAVEDAYGNAGILQRLIADLLDEVGVEEQAPGTIRVDDLSALEHAELFYADELNSVYQTFANRVSAGIRNRQNATGIYAHALAVALDASDDDLIQGVSIDRIFAQARAREPRIIKGNLRTALGRIESMQVDEAGRGLVLSYAEERVRVVDRQVLLYRKYRTVKWPWEEMIQEAEQLGEAFTDA